MLGSYIHVKHHELVQIYETNLMLKSEEKSTQWTIVASRKVKQLTYIKGGLVSGGIHPSETFM
jgi:hypothetical protein